MRVALPAIVLLLAATDVVHGDDRVTILEVRVVDPQGRPVLDASVGGTLDEDNHAATFSIDERRRDGTYVLRFTPSAVQAWRGLRTIQIAAYKDGFSTSDEIVTVPKGKPGYVPIVLALRPTVAMTVRVIDTDGSPIPSARVTLDAWIHHPLAGVPQAVAPDGSVTFTGMNDRDSFEVSAEAPGHLKQKRSSVDPTKPLVIQTVRGGVFTGRLVDCDTGAPIANCKLYEAWGFQTTSDTEGNFMFPSIPYRDVQLSPACADYGTDYDHAWQGIRVRFEASEVGKRLDVRARKNQVVHGRVIDRKHKPVANARVQRILIPSRPMFLLRPAIEDATTDRNGRFTFSSSSMDNFEIYVTAPFESLHHNIWFARQRGPIELTPK